jgi:transposase
MQLPDIQVLVLNAANLAVIYQSLKKSDREDALKLARLVQRFTPEELPIVPVPSDQEMERRALSSHEDSFRRDRTRLINRLHAVFLRCGIPDHTKAQLKKAATRERIIEAELAGFSKVEALNLHCMISEYERILAGLVEEIGVSVREGGESACILMSIPGFGLKTTMAILAYAGDMHRFNGPSQLVNYVGLSPRLHESGELERKGSITKRGNAHLRGLLVQSAWGLVRSKRTNPLKSRYEAMIDRGKGRRCCCDRPETARTCLCPAFT